MTETLIRSSFDSSIASARNLDLEEFKSLRDSNNDEELFLVTSPISSDASKFKATFADDSNGQRANSVFSDKAELSINLVSYPALRILEPARKKLVSLDTQRIIWCLDEGIRQIEIITAVLLAVIPKNDVLSQLKPILGIDLYEVILKLKDTLNQIESVGDHEDLEELSVLEGKICEYSKDALRMFQSNLSAVTSCISQIPTNLSVRGGRKFFSPQKLLAGLKNLRDQMFCRLLTTPIEFKEREKYLNKVEENDKCNSKAIEKLQKQLEAATDNKEKEIAKKDEAIKKLKNDLHQIEQFSSEHIRKTKRDSEMQRLANLNESESRLSKLNSDYDQLSNVYDKMLEEHRDVEQQLRKRKYKIETEVENWISKYDQEMTEKQDEYEEIDAIYTEEKKQLSELEEKFKVLSEEYDAIMEERRKAMIARELQNQDDLIQKSAATTIQAYFRAYKVRKMLKTKGKKGKKSKKGKKKR